MKSKFYKFKFLNIFHSLKISNFKFQIIPVILVVLLILVVPTSVSAHVLENNGSIGAVLHIDPADDPIAKAQSILFFSFKDKANTFKLSECECVFTVSAEKNVLYTQPLTSIDSNSENDAVVSYSFPEKNVYTLTVSGKPSRENTFKPFTLSYTIRVEQEIKKTDVQNSPSIPILPLVIFCVAILFVFAMIRRRKQK